VKETVFVLTHEYGDGSGFHICGVTSDQRLAHTWTAAGDSENHVYEIEKELIMPRDVGFKPSSM
jgi:hypothetical protein